MQCTNLLQANAHKLQFPSEFQGNFFAEFVMSDFRLLFLRIFSDYSTESFALLGSQLERFISIKFHCTPTFYFAKLKLEFL